MASIGSVVIVVILLDAAMAVGVARSIFVDELVTVARYSLFRCKFGAQLKSNVFVAMRRFNLLGLGLTHHSSPISTGWKMWVNQPVFVGT
jgi:hypothetical protein